MKRKYIEVYRNNEKVDEILDRHSHKACKEYVRHNLYDTHMGSWVKKQEPKRGFEYNTTIGVYYSFVYIG